MSIRVEMTNGAGEVTDVPFEVLPRAGEIVFWPGDQSSAPYRVVGVSHYRGRNDFQARLHVVRELPPAAKAETTVPR